MNRLRMAALGATLFTALAAAPFVVQAASPGAPSAMAFKAPRNAFGQPDLQGNWSNVSMTPESRGPGLTALVYTPEQVAKLEGAAQKEETEANKKTDPNAGAPAVGGDKPAPGTRPEFAAAGGAVGGYDRGWLDPGNGVMRVHGEPRTSILTTANGHVPATKPGVAPEPAFRPGTLGPMDNVEQRSLGERCIMGFGRNAGPPMLANGFYNNDYQIVQTKDEVAIVVEMVHDVRTIRLNAAHRTDGIRPWMGDSIGHYDGDTLVVETTNFPKAMAYHGSWKDLKVTERFTRVTKDRILYQFTVDDPTMWDKPWGGEYEFHPLGGEIYEYACHEGNYALEHILAGARAEEAAAAKAQGATKGGAAKGE
jgi:hypothetical protein